MGRPRISAIGSSKYEFDPEQFDRDIASKREAARRFEEDLERVIYGNYCYNDNIRMSYSAKSEILTNVHLKFYNKLNGIKEVKQ